MKVKIGDQIINSEDQPLMVIFSIEEVPLISNMGDHNTFCSYPMDMDEEDVVKFMAKED